MFWEDRPDSKGWVPPKGHTPKIVAAANRIDGVIYVGARHFDLAMKSQMGIRTLGRPVEQGFIDQFARFWNREEAYQICILTNVKLLRTEDWGEKLYSEDLY